MRLPRRHNHIQLYELIVGVNHCLVATAPVYNLPFTAGTCADTLDAGTLSVAREHISGGGAGILSVANSGGGSYLSRHIALDTVTRIVIIFRVDNHLLCRILLSENLI